MTITRIDTSFYRSFCQDFRQGYERDVENGLCGWTEYREYLRAEKPADHLLFSDEYTASQQCSATFEEIYSALRFASSRRQQFGATDAQCRAIAARWAGEGASLASCNMNTLTIGDARAILG